MHRLHALGWTEFFQKQLLELSVSPANVARVVDERRGMWRIRSIDEQDQNVERWAVVSGRLRHLAETSELWPKVGDWVVCRSDDAQDNDRVLIDHVLQRRTKLSRKEVGESTTEQVIAANVDKTFIVTSLNQELNPRRLERYLVMAWEGGTVPIIVLTKSDLVEGIEAYSSQVEDIAAGSKIICVSSHTGAGLDQIKAELHPGETFVLVGSSGVGKSTLVNRLLNEVVQTTSEIRDTDGKGRHTTTARTMLTTSTGAMLIDTPGLRELATWDSEEGIARVFDDLSQLATQCKFTDCTHTSEPGCALVAGVASGEVTQDRIDAYHKLQREQAYLDRKKDKAAMAAERNKWKSINKQLRDHPKYKRGK